jgi:hypothetical protein
MTQLHKAVDSQEEHSSPLDWRLDPRDWVTIWQSEWAAMAVDREMQEGLTAVTDAWNTALAARTDGSSGCAGADAAPGAASTGDAFGAGEPGPALP